MAIHWPLLSLLIPLLLTFTGSRTAWLWVSIAIAGPAVNVLLNVAYAQIASYGVTAPLAPLVLPENSSAPLSGSNVFVFGYISGLTSAVIPALIIGPLLFIKAHPKRAMLDIALFWAITALLLTASIVFGAALSGIISPQGDGPDPGFFSRVERVMMALRLAAFVLACIAALRPVLSWWRTRKASHAI